MLMLMLHPRVDYGSELVSRNGCSLKAINLYCAVYTVCLSVTVLQIPFLFQLGSETPNGIGCSAFAFTSADRHCAEIRVHLRTQIPDVRTCCIDVRNLHTYITLLLLPVARYQRRC